MDTILVLLCCSLLALTSAASTDIRFPTVAEDLPQIQHFDSRIVGGSNSDTAQFPWHVSVRSHSIASSITCGGALIDLYWVLTAAHCVQGYSQFTIGIGSGSLSRPLVEMNSTIGVVNPTYNAATFNNDIALIRLPSGAYPTIFIQSIRLPTVSQAAATFLGFPTTVSGFGRLNNSTTELSDWLQFVYMRVMTNVDCQAIYGTSVVIASTMCAEGWTAAAQGACLGDSGGPQVIYENGVPTLIGIISFISARGCGAGDPTGFTRTSFFLHWINAVTGIPLRN